MDYRVKSCRERAAGRTATVSEGERSLATSPDDGVAEGGAVSMDS